MRSKNAKTTMMTSKPTPPVFGDSWDVRNWPANVWPHKAARAKHCIDCNRDALVKAGVISRVGREIVVNGDAWRRWLHSSQNRQQVNAYQQKEAP